MKLALTGATGFVGRATLARALAGGHQVSALARSPQPARDGVEWVTGDLDATTALDRLVAGTDAVLHIAGVVNARDRAGFEAGNGRGTAHVIAAMEREGARRLIHISSLAAREPTLSNYGWSKAEAERNVLASPLDWTMVRPPAIYGGDDRDLLELFVMAKRGLILLPPGGHLSVIEVGDLARLLLALATDTTGASIGQTYEVDDGTPGGWTHREFARAVARAVGRKKVLTLALPSPLIRLAARIDRLTRGDRARLTPDRAGYMCHPDWVSRAALAPPSELWGPRMATPDGLAQTAATYRARGWL